MKTYTSPESGKVSISFDIKGMAEGTKEDILFQVDRENFLVGFTYEKYAEGKYTYNKTYIDGSRKVFFRMIKTTNAEHGKLVGTFRFPIELNMRFLASVAEVMLKGKKPEDAVFILRATKTGPNNKDIRYNVFPQNADYKKDTPVTPTTPAAPIVFNEMDAMVKIIEVVTAAGGTASGEVVRGVIEKLKTGNIAPTKENIEKIVGGK